MSSAWFLWVLAGYVCGSIPFGLLIGLARGIDIRTRGSGNVGATNCGRVLGRRWGAVCFVLDVSKGLAPVVAAGVVLGFAGRARLSAPEAFSWLAVGAASVLGHVFPLWLGFKGGKGVATGLGVLLGVWPLLTIAALGAVLTWLLLAGLLRFVSLASIVAALALPLYVVATCWVRDRALGEAWPFLLVTCALSALVVLRHRGNIGRLLEGTEPRIRHQRRGGSS